MDCSSNQENTTNRSTSVDIMKSINRLFTYLHIQNNTDEYMIVHKQCLSILYILCYEYKKKVTVNEFEKNITIKIHYYCDLYNGNNETVKKFAPIK